MIIIFLILIVITAEYSYWSGYQKGYGSAKNIYDETCGPEELILKHNKICQ